MREQTLDTLTPIWFTICSPSISTTANYAGQNSDLPVKCWKGMLISGNILVRTYLIKPGDNSKQ